MVDTIRYVVSVDARIGRFGMYALEELETMTNAMTTKPQSFYVVYIKDQGYGWMSARDYDEAREFAPNRVTSIASFATEAQGREAYSCLPQEWKDIEGLHYANGEWWKAAGISAPNPDGRVLELFMPADRPVPIFSTPPGNKSC